MKIINLSQGKETFVDDEDFDFLNQYKWSASQSDKNFYAVRTARVRDPKHPRMIRMHRVIMDVSDDLYIDHIDGNSLNNQKSNLRICTNQQNSSAIQRKRLKGSSMFRGVSFVKYSKTMKWLASIRHNYKKISIGYFDSEIEAAKAWDNKCRELRGEFAVTNF